MARYAKRINADFLVVQERKYSLLLRGYVNGDLPVYEKFRLADFLEQYDRVLYLDSDILITPQARDIFAEFSNPKFFYAYDEGHILSTVIK